MSIVETQPPQATDTGPGSDQIFILGIPGSLRSGSLNYGLLRAARAVAPAGVEIRIADLARIPMFNEDLEALGDPAPVQGFKQQIRRADALLIATPEYNGSIPGLLKNALDWASRPPRQSALAGKLIALMGASLTPSGTANSQADLQRMLARTRSLVLTEAQVLLANAAPLFDASGNLIDDTARQQVRALLAALVAKAHQGEGNASRASWQQFA